MQTKQNKNSQSSSIRFFSVVDDWYTIYIHSLLHKFSNREINRLEMNMHTVLKCIRHFSMQSEQRRKEANKININQFVPFFSTKCNSKLFSLHLFIVWFHFSVVCYRVAANLWIGAFFHFTPANALLLFRLLLFFVLYPTNWHNNVLKLFN